MTNPFATSSDIRDNPAGKQFGQRYNGRYHMPLLPGERGVKSGGDWVPYGIQSATNLAGAVVDTWALGEWARERSQMGLAVRPDLYERLAFAVRLAHRGYANPERPDEDLFSPGVKISAVAPELKAELQLIHEEATKQAGADAASRQGTNRHDVWEARAYTGQLFGTPEINRQIEQLEQLLADKHLVRVPNLSERVVRNTALVAAGKFDDVLMDERTGTFYMGDLKTKRRQYYTWLEVRIQMAVYATADWMLTGDLAYVPGPAHHVSQEVGIVLRMPADGSTPELRKIDLVKGLAHAHLARAVVDARSEAKNVQAFRESVWE